MLDAPTHGRFITLIVEHLKEEQRCPIVRSPIVYANYLVVSNPSSFGRKIEKSFTTFVGGGCEALRDKRAASKTGAKVIIYSRMKVAILSR